MQYSGCSFVKGREKGSLVTHQKSCIEKMVECFDVSTKSNNPVSRTRDLRPREWLREEFEGLERQLIGGLI